MKPVGTYLLTLLFFCSFLFSNAQNLVNSEFIGERTSEEVSDLLNNVMELEYDISMYKLQYTTTNLEGGVDTASGLVVVPDIAGAIFPSLLFQRGTSNNRLDVPSNLQGDWEFIAGSGALGYFSFSPDLLGMGDSPGFPPYLHAETEASASIDMLFAVQEFVLAMGFSLNEQLFVCGYSQGGHSAMAAYRELQENYAAEFPVTAAVPMAGPYSLSGIMRDLIISDEAYSFPGFPAYLILSYNQIYQWYDSTDEIFKAQFVPPMDSFFREEINFFDLDTLLLTQLRADFGLDQPKLMFQDSIREQLINNPDHPINIALRENDVFDWKPEAPTRLLYCEGDDRVPFENSIVAEATMLGNGAPDLEVFNVNSDLDHRECAEPSAVLAALFFETFKMLVPIEEAIALVPDIEIYPNPTQDYFRIKNAPLDARVYLFDTNGSVVWSEDITQSPVTFSISSLPAGYYGVKVVSRSGSWMGKLVTH